MSHYCSWGERFGREFVVTEATDGGVYFCSILDYDEGAIELGGAGSPPFEAVYKAIAECCWRDWQAQGLINNTEKFEKFFNRDGEDDAERIAHVLGQIGIAN